MGITIFLQILQEKWHHNLTAFYDKKSRDIVKNTLCNKLF